LPGAVACVGQRRRCTDFWPAFLVVALISALSGFILGRLEPSAGAEMSGHAIVQEKRAADST
jgi:hypothetical protein